MQSPAKIDEIKTRYDWVLRSTGYDVDDTEKQRQSPRSEIYKIEAEFK